MKRSKEKAQREQDAEESQAMFSDVITEEMKRGVWVQKVGACNIRLNTYYVLAILHIYDAGKEIIYPVML